MHVERLLGGKVEASIYVSCYLHPDGLKGAIESHLAQYRADDAQEVLDKICVRTTTTTPTRSSAGGCAI